MSLKMSYGILNLFGFLLWFYGALADDCEVEYVAAFKEDIYSCDDFDNQMLNAEGLKLSAGDGEGEEESMTMTGSILLSREIEEGFAIQVEIYKETELGNKEFVNGARWDICSNMQNTEAPWYPVMECLGVTECPIPVKEYPIEDLQISLDSVKNVMTHEFCGDYEVHLCVVDDLDELSCHIINLGIVEKPSEDCKR